MQVFWIFYLLVLHLNILLESDNLDPVTFSFFFSKPYLGTPHKIQGIRRYAIQRFPYLIFYTQLEEVIWVMAIAHSKRKPDYWKQRDIEI